MHTLRQRDAVVEVLGWDEAFLGITTDDPEAVARQVQRDVLEATRLHCSIGIGDNKLRAKTATGFAKPQGVFRLTRQNWFEVMGARPTEALWGIGRKTSRKLDELGITTVSQLAAADRDVLAARLGPTMGPWYRQLGRGVSSATVDGEPYVPRSHSRETTFQQNLSEPDDIRREVDRLARRVTQDVLDDGRLAARVALKIRFAPFFTQTRSAALPEPTRDADVIAEAVLALLERFEPGRAVRLLGVRAEFAANEHDA
jgi:DNA polymerase-4